MQGGIAWGYVATTLGYLAAAAWHAWATAGAGDERPARWLARAVWVLHSAVLAAEVAGGRVPFLSATGSVYFLSWAWVLNGLLLESLLPLRALGAFMLPPVVVLLVLVAAAAGAGPGTSAGAGAALAAGPAGGVAGAAAGSSARVALQLAGGAAPWVWLHAVIALLSYVAFGLASALAVMYLLLERQLRVKAFTGLYRRLPSLEIMDRTCWWLIGGGFALLTLALLSGSLPAGSLWGRRWASDGKVIASAAVWLFYAGCLALRAWAGWRGRRLAYLSLLGFAVILANYLLVGLHWSNRHVFHVF